ncbi:DUF6414 family protein [Dermacoccus abyssi]|uniref:DUF6414 family protein n=1 Tax=Dermacoccus abyssi TaxID=322596 RepID=UPI002AD2CEE0|nr:hypothetical protein [Dermacoccus abyssi]
MLISAQYLDRDALLNYIAGLEGGVRQTGVSRSKGSRGIGAALGAGPVRADARGDRESEDTLTTTDHDASRLQRLIAAGRESPDALRWVEVLEPDTDFADLSLGEFIEWECDIFMPEGVAALSNQSGFREALRQFQDLAPAARALGLDMNGMPAENEMQAMGTFLENLDVPPVVVGEDSDTAWRVVGSLTPQWVRPGATLDDRVRIIGKVKKVVGEGKWYPLISLPGMNLVSREERRRMEREGPADAAMQANYAQGPLLVVEYLAIYS